MPTVTNKSHRDLGAAARRAWTRLKDCQPNIDYPVDVKGQPLICWTQISAPVAVLQVMFVHPAPAPNSQPFVTYLQVRRDGNAVRSLTRPAGTAELERWFALYPADRPKFMPRLELV